MESVLMTEEDLTPSQSMIRLLMSFIAARAIYVAAKLDVADQIDAAGSTAESLAARLDVDAPALERVLFVLSGIGVLRCDDAGRFVLTAVGDDPL